MYTTSFVNASRSVFHRVRLTYSVLPRFSNNSIMPSRGARVVSTSMEDANVVKRVTRSAAKQTAGSSKTSPAAVAQPGEAMLTGSKRKRTVKKAEMAMGGDEVVDSVVISDGQGSKKKKKSVKTRVVKDEVNEDEVDTDEVQKSVKKKTKKKKDSEDAEEAEKKPKVEMQVISVFNIPVKEHTVKRSSGPSPNNGTISFTNNMYIGAHVSAAGGLENAVINAVEIGAKSFALFLRSQRQWVAKPMEDSTVEKFKAACVEHGISPHLILPHGSYLLNLGSPDETTLAKSRTLLLDELQRCDRLGLLYYNIHPGSSCGQISREESIQRIADSINWAHAQMPGSPVSVVLENMCRQGNTIGGDLSDLAEIIERVIDQSRVGVCLDTCHAFAAGYDIATGEGLESFIEEFDRIVGFQYLVAVHLNDSEGPRGCHRDRHASIGKGHIGIEGFRNIVNCPRFRDIPIILETPYTGPEVYDREISLLNSLITYKSQ